MKKKTAHRVVHYGAEDHPMGITACNRLYSNKVAVIVWSWRGVTCKHCLWAKKRAEASR